MRNISENNFIRVCLFSPTGSQHRRFPTGNGSSPWPIVRLVVGLLNSWMGWDKLPGILEESMEKMYEQKCCFARQIILARYHVIQRPLHRKIAMNCCQKVCNNDHQWLARDAFGKCSVHGGCRLADSSWNHGCFCTVVFSPCCFIRRPWCRKH